MLRADKFLAAQNIANMIYTNGDLTKIRYNNDTDVNYEVLNYTSGNLSSINHYVGGVLKGTTTLSYSSGNLVSAVFA
jgi:antitoxin component YwqK of YwqJK toxin-antitoxin module